MVFKTLKCAGLIGVSASSGTFDPAIIESCGGAALSFVKGICSKNSLLEDEIFIDLHGFTW